MMLVTIGCSIKICWTPQEDDLRAGYTPRGARSHAEFRGYQRFYADAQASDLEVGDLKRREGSGGGGGEPLVVIVFVRARDHGSMTRVEYLNDTIDLLDDISERFKLVDRSFNDFCMYFCHLNEGVRQFRVS